MVDISLLGCGGGMPMPERFLSSFLINYRGRKILIDCGEGTQVSMKILGWGFKSIDVICITHGHGDHIVGLPGLLATIGNSGRTEPITLIGPEGIESIIKGLRVIAPYLPYDINIIENPKEICRFSITASGLKLLEEDVPIYNNSIKNVSKTILDKDFHSEDISISTLELFHSSPCIGYSFYIKRRPKFNMEMAIDNSVPKILWNRLQKGEILNYEGNTYEPKMVLGNERRGIKISYITDTRPINTIPDFISGSDLFICEGTYGDDNDLEKAKKNKHMTFSEAAHLADKAKVHKLLLTHFSPAMAEPEFYKNNAETIFKNTIIGTDRFVKSLAFRD